MFLKRKKPKRIQMTMTQPAHKGTYQLDRTWRQICESANTFSLRMNKLTTECEEYTESKQIGSVCSRLAERNEEEVKTNSNWQHILFPHIRSSIQKRIIMLKFFIVFQRFLEDQIVFLYGNKMGNETGS